MKLELQKQRDTLAERQADEFIHIHTLSNLYAKQSFIEGFDTCHAIMSKEIEILKSKNRDLEKIIAKEISENDDFGSEFVIASILRNKLDTAKKALEFYADVNSYNYFPATSDPECGAFVGFVEENEAGDRARQALKEME